MPKGRPESFANQARTLRNAVQRFKDAPSALLMRVSVFFRRSYVWSGPLAPADLSGHAGIECKSYEFFIILFDATDDRSS
jgi:hypothetical protein